MAAAAAQVPALTAAAAGTKPAAAADAHALPSVHYAFAGPLNAVRSGEVKNDNPYSEWQKHSAYGPYMASKFLPWHHQFRDAVVKMAAHLAACAAVGDSAWQAFVTTFQATWKVLDIHHRIEDSNVFPQLDALYGPRVGDSAALLKAGASLMDTPKMLAQHHELLVRTAALFAMISADATTKASADATAGAQLLRDLRTEYDGWRVTLLEHLRDEEVLVMPLMLLAADKLKLPPPPGGAGAAGAGGPPGAAAGAAAGAGGVAPAGAAAGGSVAALTAAVAAAKVDPHALPVVHYAFAGPLNAVRGGSEVKNDNPYSAWQQTPNYGASMVPRFLPFHVQFRDGATKMHALAHVIKHVNDSAWQAFVAALHATWKVLDIHHRIEDDHVFPQLDKLFPDKKSVGDASVMDTPKMLAQHHELLVRTAALFAMISADAVAKAAADSTGAKSAHLVRDLAIEYDGWQYTLLEHLRDEELIVIPLMLLAGDKLKPPTPPAGGFPGGGVPGAGGAPAVAGGAPFGGAIGAAPKTANL